MEQLIGNWEMVVPKASDHVEQLKFNEDKTYSHQLLSNRNEVIESFYGSYELVPKPNELTELIFYPSEEQAIIDPKTHLYLHTSYFIKKLGNELVLLDYPGKSENYEFLRI